MLRGSSKTGGREGRATWVAEERRGGFLHPLLNISLRLPGAAGNFFAPLGTTLRRMTSLMVRVMGLCGTERSKEAPGHCSRFVGGFFFLMGGDDMLLVLILHMNDPTW